MTAGTVVRLPVCTPAWLITFDGGWTVWTVASSVDSVIDRADRIAAARQVATGVRPSFTITQIGGV